MARFPATQNEVLVEMYCDSTADPGVKWRDITTDVRWSEMIKIRHGRPDESSEAPPANCWFVLNDADNLYGRRNPMSPYFGFFGLGTRLRVRVTTMKDLFSATAVDSWGTPTISTGAWRHEAVGNVPAPATANFDKSGGVGTVVVPAATNTRFCVSSANELYEDCDIQVTWSMAVAITGAEVLPANLMTHVEGTSTSYTYVRLGVQTDNTIQMGLRTSAGTILAAQATVSGVTYTPGVDYTVRLVAHGQFVAAKIWAASGPEPEAWSTTAYNRVWIRGVPGAVGLRTASGTGNTNANLLVSYKNWYVRSNRFSGEISALEPGQDTSGNYQYTSIEAAGLLRRLSQGDDPLQSAMRRGTPGTSALLAYWPMEEGASATQFTAATPNTYQLSIQSDGVLPKFAADSDFLCSAPLPKFNASFFGAVLPDYDPSINGSTQLRFLLKIPTGGAATNSVVARLWGEGTARLWQIVYTTGGNLVIEAYNRSVVNLFTTPAAFAVDGDLLRVSMDLDQVGANIDWVLSVYQVGTAAAQTLSGTLAGRTISRSTYVDFNPFGTLTETVIGHITVQTGLSSVTDLNLQLNSYVGEAAQARLVRLAGENAAPFLDLGWTGTALMGPQTVERLLPLIREAADTDMGSLFDSRALDAPRLEYRSLASAFNQLPVLTVDLSAGQIAPPWSPVDDDQQVRNDVTAKNKKGGDYRSTLDTGPMSTLAATAGGVGRYASSYSANAASDAQLPDIAGWRVALGTVNEYRFPVLKVNLGNSNVVAANLQNAALSANVDDLVRITGAEASHVFDDVDQLVRGYSEILGSTEHQLTFNCSSATPYTVTKLDATGAVATDIVTYLDAKTAVLDEAINSTATLLRVRSETETWTSTVPYPIVIGGERMLVTAVSAAPAFVSAGAAVHADNTSLAPALPAGHSAKDLLVLLAAIRNSGTGTVDTPPGYTLIGDGSNARLFGKIDNGAEVAPTVNFTGGVAGATTSAQMAAFRRVLLNAFHIPTPLLNGSGQNIALATPATPPGPYTMVIQWGWKADDWTSVGTLLGATEIGEPSSTLGSDQGIVWDYQLCDGLTTGPWGTTFAVTGGAAAISRGGSLSLRCVQELTVTRSVNGVVKSHAAAAPIHVAQPARFAV